MIIYLLTFYLLNDIEKYQNHSYQSFCYVKGNLYVYIVLRFALGIAYGDRCDRKLQLFYSRTILFWSLNLVTPLLFEELLVLSSKHLNILLLTRLIALVVVNTMTQISPFILFTKINGEHMVVKMKL